MLRSCHALFHFCCSAITELVTKELPYSNTFERPATNGRTGTGLVPVGWIDLRVRGNGLRLDSQLVFLKFKLCCTRTTVEVRVLVYCTRNEVPECTASTSC